MTTHSKKFLTVGSLLRPSDLLDYRQKIEHRDDIAYPFYDSLPGYLETETADVHQAIDQQVAHGLSEISDGELSRSLWHLDFAWGLEGIRRYITDHGYLFADHGEDLDDKSFQTRQDIGLAVEGKLSGHNHPFIDHFKRLKAHAPSEVGLKFPIVTPGHIYYEIVAQGAIGPDNYYQDLADFRHDLVQSYRHYLDDYQAAGGEIVQLDDCVWNAFAGDSNDHQVDLDTFRVASLDELAKQLIAMNNAVADYAHELGLKVYGHNCRGNYASRYAGGGSYSEVAEYFLKQQRYDRFYLEWDDDRAGSLEVLKIFADRPEVEVVVGCLSSKQADLDDADRALDMLEEASQYIPKDRLYLSHQCGFASCDVGNELSHDQQWAKIDQGHQIAHQFFGE
ncbi:5-methyltetrahydropteroyltriglutamate--homocysteine methyltransferase [Aerococcus urinaehominis]|uniref:5-methyltetrahydropteroyltriglutamate--homocysteine methyltransferase n=1 Tax=Aerococcus urinaehominis TaxID=128944 RepID=A0A109RHD1_9LACT|nr:5-methyltetrahydropteroyltriglutamate--homocysteine methyltransferase [Aerococcus urinaehominis]AMB99999.1 5-methyltetrahydropteroyltriglutamate--homocysteine methyltransferase [Aerococcus urinaehominis]SDL82453.1 Methionine synthase II (cobalamin-independent) [Aerococcus urinaehominis]